MLKISMYGDTNIGLVRSINEDNFRLIPQRNTLVVCDGMGGHAAGEVASLRAVETIEAFFLRDLSSIKIRLPQPDMPQLPSEAIGLVQSIRLANRRVFLTAQEQRILRGMGTTLVAVHFADGRVIICHVGDSRVYRFSRGHLAPMTIDHSLLAEWKAKRDFTEEEERNFPERNIITRALGTRPSVAVDVGVVPAERGDWYLLCSDGLCGYVNDTTIGRIVAESHTDAKLAISRLIDAANAAGGQDNVTVAIGVIDDVAPVGDFTSMNETIPETQPESAPLEIAYLQELFPPGNGAAFSIDDADTDKIPTLPFIVARPGDLPRDAGTASSKSPDKKKRGLWPWSDKAD